MEHLQHGGPHEAAVDGDAGGGPHQMPCEIAHFDRMKLVTVVTLALFPM
jgi:hypothetical protein